MTTSQVICQCGALYERTEFNAAPRESYRLLSGPIGMPEADRD
jgi:hypothetical protein